MADENKRVDIRFQTTADTSGAEQAEAAIRGTEVATEQAAEEAKRLDAAFAGLDAPALAKIRQESQTTAQATEQLRARALALDTQLAQVRGFSRWGSEARRLRSEAAQTREALRRLETQARQTDRVNVGTGILDGLSAMPGRIGAAGAAFSRFASVPVAAAAAGLVSFGASVRAAIGASGKAAAIEDLTASFVTLLGSVQAAQERMRELSRFAAETPFELPEIAGASRILENLTNGALATGNGLRLVGNIAALTNEHLELVATTVGRLYDGLDSGRPIGEPAQRLQELGALGGETRAQLEALQKEGLRGQEVWAVAAASFAKFEGEMERRSKTVNGLLSTLRDAWTGLQRTIGEPINDRLRPMIRGWTLALDTLQGAISKVAGSLRTMPQGTAEIQKQTRGVEDLAEAWRGTNSAAEAAVRTVDQIGEAYDRARSRAEQLADAQEQIAQAELARRLAEIDAREDLTESQRIQERARITGGAEEKEFKGAEQRLQREIDLRTRQEEELQRIRKESSAGLQAALQRQSEILAKSSEPGGLEDLRARLLTLTQARDEINEARRQLSEIGLAGSASPLTAPLALAGRLLFQEDFEDAGEAVQRLGREIEDVLARIQKAEGPSETDAVDLAQAQGQIEAFTAKLERAQAASEKLAEQPDRRPELQREIETLRRVFEIEAETREIQTGKELSDALRAEQREAFALQAEQQEARTSTLVEQLRRQLEDLPAVVQQSRPGTRTEEFLAELTRRREAVEAEGGPAEAAAIPALNALRELITRGLRTPTAEIRAALEPLRTAIDTLIGAITERERVRALAESERTPAPQPAAAIDARIEELGRIIASAIAGLRAEAQRPAEPGERPPPAPVSRADAAALRERGLTTAAALPTLERILARLIEARFGETPPTQDVGPLIIAIQQLIELLRTREAQRPAAPPQPPAAASPELVSLARRVADGIGRLAATPAGEDARAQQIQETARREELPRERLETPEAIPALERLIEAIGPERETAPELRALTAEIRALIQILSGPDTRADRPAAQPSATDAAISRIEQALSRREPSRAPDATAIDPAIAGEIREALRALAPAQERTSSTAPLERREATAAALEELSTRLTRHEDTATRELAAEIRGLIRMLSAPPREPVEPRGTGTEAAEIAARIEEAIRAIPAGGLDEDTRADVRALVAAVRERDIPARAPRAQGAPPPQPIPGLERVASQIEGAGFRELASEIRQLIAALRAREIPVAAPRAEPPPARIAPRPREVRQPVTPQPALAPQDGAARQAAAGIASDTTVADALLAIGAALQTQGAQQQAAAQTLLATLQSLTNQQRALLSRMSTLEQQTRNLRD
jgi:hypothetical protein